MRTLLGIITVLALALGLFMAVGTAGEEAGTAGMSAPDIEGTWIFVKRTLPDGTVLTPPAIAGAMTFADGIRNFNLLESGPDGKYFSIGLVAKYELTASEYKETCITYTHNDQLHGLGTMSDMSGVSNTSQITWSDGTASWPMPNFGEPSVSLKGNSLTATREGQFVDTWKKLE